MDKTDTDQYRIIKSFDVDIDFADRDRALSFFNHIPASMIREGKLTKHNTGVYFTKIPYNPMTQTAAIDYKTAEQRGYFKIDCLNVLIYRMIRDQDHYDKILNKEPAWTRLYDREFCKNLIHIGNHYYTLIKMPDKITSISEMAMFLSVIRPAKRHLIGKPWLEVAKTVWDKDPGNNAYGYKKAHAISYATLVGVHMNLLSEQEDPGFLETP